MRDLPRNVLPSHVLVRQLLAPALVFIAAAMDRGYQTDFWHHLARGREIVRQRAVVDVDAFTFTLSGQAFRDGNWLSQVVFYRLFSWGGISTVQVVNAIVMAAALAVLVRLCRRVSASTAAAAIAGTIAFVGLWQLTLIRPQTFSLLLFALMYAVLLEAESRRRLLLLPPVMMALWANVHGGFPIGLVLIAAFACAQLIRFVAHGRDDDRSNHSHGVLCFLACGIASLGATCLNPYGWHIYQYVGSITSVAASRHVQEWLPPDFHSMVGAVFWLSAIAVVGLFAANRRRPSARELCLLLLFFPLACRSVRMVAWWLVIAAPIMASLLTETFSLRDGPRVVRPSGIAAATAALLVSMCVLSIPSLERFNPLFGRLRSARRPEADLIAIEQRLTGRASACDRIFARLEWGEHLDWSLGPSRRVFMDGRIETYPDGIWHSYCQVISGGDGWQKPLDAFHVQTLLLDATSHQRLLQAVRASGRWKEVDKSGPVVLFQRQNQAEIAKNMSANP